MRQAISWYRAVVTRQWAVVGDKPSPPPAYDFEKINFWLQCITLDEVRWENYFRHLGGSVVRLAYEDFDDDTVPRIGRFLDREVPTKKRESEFRIQRDELTDQWVERFLRDTGTELIFSTLEMEQRLAEM